MRLDDSQSRLSTIATAGAAPATAALRFIAAGDGTTRSVDDEACWPSRNCTRAHSQIREAAKPASEFCKGALAYHRLSRPLACHRVESNQRDRTECCDFCTSSRYDLGINPNDFPTEFCAIDIRRQRGLNGGRSALLFAASSHRLPYTTFD